MIILNLMGVVFYEYQLHLISWQCFSNSKFLLLCVCLLVLLVTQRIMLKFSKQNCGFIYLFSFVSFALSILKLYFLLHQKLWFLSSWWIFPFTITESLFLCLDDLFPLALALHIFLHPIIFSLSSHIKSAFCK